MNENFKVHLQESLRLRLDTFCLRLSSPMQQKFRGRVTVYFGLEGLADCDLNGVQFLWDIFALSGFWNNGALEQTHGATKTHPAILC